MERINKLKNYLTTMTNNLGLLNIACPDPINAPGKGSNISEGEGSKKSTRLREATPAKTGKAAGGFFNIPNLSNDWRGGRI